MEPRRLFRESVLTRAARFADTPEDRAAILAVVAETYPESTAAAFGLGQALAETGRHDEAAAAYRRALESVGSDPALNEEARAGLGERIEAARGELET